MTAAAHLVCFGHTALVNCSSLSVGGHSLQPWSNGYIAIVLTKIHQVNQVKQNLLGPAEYEGIVAKRGEDNKDGEEETPNKEEEKEVTS